ncbi:uncharacterized protein F5147DRAFT_573734 [Suillus discolor]|uniref:Uncharacterized protein n=1 Tax=Suillus discolor TaxID=1912936 RepID=A0A9P7JVW2_9AGAM|nr:uncharacterized protein F5147DRAFT_573734 [Suillus discolor]KAG2111342.1 hypothetical protein F5147DRAFT_573734 [Suillus discolor]
MQPSVTKIPDEDAPPSTPNPLSADNLALLIDAFSASVPEEFLDDPATYAEAMASPDADHWRTALQEEFDLLKNTGTYTLVPCSAVPRGHRIMKG